MWETENEKWSGEYSLRKKKKSDEEGEKESEKRLGLVRFFNTVPVMEGKGVFEGEEDLLLILYHKNLSRSLTRLLADSCGVSFPSKRT